MVRGGHESTIELNGSDNLAEIVRDRNRPISKRGALDSPAAKDLVEAILVSRMVGDRGIRVFELVPRQDAHHVFVRPNDPLLP